jgi:hypothetical protein
MIPRRAREQCIKAADQYSPMVLRRMVHAKLSFEEIRAVWFDTFDSDMYENSRDKTKLGRSVELLMLAKWADKLQTLKRNLCRRFCRKLSCTKEPAERTPLPGCVRRVPSLSGKSLRDRKGKLM